MSARTSTTTRSDASPAAGPRPAPARAEIYRFLALAFSDPVPGGAKALQHQWSVTRAAMAALGLAATSETNAAIAALDDDSLKRAHLSVFGHAVSKDCPPYGGEYGQAHIFEKSQTLADVVGFYRAFGLALAEGVHDRPDHIAFELEFMEFLSLKQALAEGQDHGAERVAFCAKAQRLFLESHLGFWAFSFAHRLQQRPAPGPFAVWADLMDDFLAQEMAAAGIPRRAEPFVNEGSLDRVEDGGCGECRGAAGDFAENRR
ncbi:MAG: molecular chaperone TorD family protein [Rhodobacteraceae bacterium]|nr:molecular chaperone TorD family protein [Paracoccaceae bacterium]